jgi:uncharacterized phiE125 gp8 family phage protein
MIGSNGPGAFVLGADRAVVADAVRAWLRMEPGAEEQAVGGAVDAAFALAEDFTGLALIARSVTEIVATRGGWRRLRATPVLAITDVAAEGGVPLPVERYRVDIDAEGDGWVWTGPWETPRLAVTLEAGLAPDWASLPAPLADGMVRMAAHLLTMRDLPGAPPAAIGALWRPYRRIRLAGREGRR